MHNCSSAQNQSPPCSITIRMESEKSCEQKALVSELIQGLELATKLNEYLNIPSSVDTTDSLLQRILSSFDKAFLILRQNAPISKSEEAMQQLTQTSSPQFLVSVHQNPEDYEGARKDDQELNQNAKKRKRMPKWTQQVRVKIQDGVEEPHHDGYSWRKYGQKNILSAKHPRSYYRCTFRKTTGCYAKKQVQRSEEDPNVLDISYHGSHICSKGNGAVPSPKSADMEEDPQGCDSKVQFHYAQSSQERLTDYTSTLSVETDNITPHLFPSFECMTQDNHHHTLFPSLVQENDPFFSTLAQTSLLSPNTPESSYFVSPSFTVHDEFDRVFDKPCADSDAAGIVLADASTANSPIFDLNFSLDAVGIGEIFPFHSKCT